MYQFSSSALKSELLATPSVFVYICLNELSSGGAGNIVEDGVEDRVGTLSHRVF